MSEQDNNLTTVEYVYAGLREYNRGRYLHCYLDRSGELKAWKKAPMGTVIGGVYKIEADADNHGSVVPRTSEYVGKSEDPEHLEHLDQWKLESAAARAKQEAERLEARLKKENTNMGELTLGEVRAMMHNRLGHQRQGIMAAVMNYMSGGF